VAWAAHRRHYDRTPDAAKLAQHVRAQGWDTYVSDASSADAPLRARMCGLGATFLTYQDPYDASASAMASFLERRSGQTAAHSGSQFRPRPTTLHEAAVPLLRPRGHHGGYIALVDKVCPWCCWCTARRSFGFKVASSGRQGESNRGDRVGTAGNA